MAHLSTSWLQRRQRVELVREPRECPLPGLTLKSDRHPDSSHAFGRQSFLDHVVSVDVCAMRVNCPNTRQLIKNRQYAIDLVNRKWFGALIFEHLLLTRPGE